MTRPTSGSRTIWIMAAVAVVSLAGGLGLSQLIKSPAEAAAATAPPAAGPITVPVESRVLSNDVTIRGDVRYDDPAQIRIETGDLGGPAIVTGHVPDVGTTLEAASVALEVAGRPVIVLVGALPTYRTLSAGVSGPDVLQLKSALAALGIDAGDTASDRYDAATAAGVIALYHRVGYEPPTPSKALADALVAARDQIAQAQDALAAAQRARVKATAGPAQSELIRLDADVRSAQQDLDDATAACATVTTTPDPTATDSPATTTCSKSAVVRAQGTLDAAGALRAEGTAAPDTSVEKAQVAVAERQVADAKTALAQAQTQTLTALPASEVVFVPSLPRRIDDVSVTRGATVSGPVMSVSGATLEIVANASSADAELISVGATGSIAIKGEEIAVTVTSIEQGTAKDAASDTAADGSPAADTTSSPSTSGRSTVTLLPGTLTDAQLTALQGSNVRVKIPVSSTGGKVLAVPLAALTAGPGGEARIEIARADDTTDLVTVATGLAAGGYVQITPSGATVAAGDLVAVGTRGTTASSGSTATPTPEPSAGGGA